MKKFIIGFVSAITLMFAGLVFADRVSVPSISNLQSATSVVVDYLGLGISDAGAVTATTFTATSTTATSSIAYKLQIGTTTAVTQTQLLVLNPLTSPATKATSTITIGDPTATSTSRAGVNIQSDYGSTTCAYVDGTSTPVWKLIAGACSSN